MTVFALLVSGISHLLADLYLIGHVAITNVSAADASTVLPKAVSLGENVSLFPTQVSAETSSMVFADEWNCQSENALQF